MLLLRVEGKSYEFILMAIWGIVAIWNLKFEINSGEKYRETINTGNIIRDLIKVILCW